MREKNIVTVDVLEHSDLELRKKVLNDLLKTAKNNGVGVTKVVEDVTEDSIYLMGSKRSFLKYYLNRFPKKKEETHYVRAILNHIKRLFVIVFA
jgi:hypothetical protein